MKADSDEIERACNIPDKINAEGRSRISQHIDCSHTIVEKRILTFSREMSEKRYLILPRRDSRYKRNGFSLIHKKLRPSVSLARFSTLEADSKLRACI